jgi:hypothetical protein
MFANTDANMYTTANMHANTVPCSTSGTDCTVINGSIIAKKNDAMASFFFMAKDNIFHHAFSTV